MDPKVLKTLLKVLRDNGVTFYKTSELELHVSPEAILPESTRSRRQAEEAQESVETDNPYANFPDGILTEEQLMYYSAGGLPEQDPFAKKDN